MLAISESDQINIHLFQRDQGKMNHRLSKSTPT